MRLECYVCRSMTRVCIIVDHLKRDAPLEEAMEGVL